MTWVRIDDAFPEHPKVLSLGDDYERGVALHVRGLCYCARNLTDGHVPARMFREDAEIRSRLVEVGMWHEVEGGFVIHDYLDYNPSKAEALALSESRRAAGKAGADARWNGKRDGKSHGKSHGKTMANGCPVPEPVPDPDTEDPNPTPQTPQAVGRWEKRLSPKQLADLLQTFGKEQVTATAEQLEAEERDGLEVKSFPSLLKHRLEHPKPIPSAPDAYTAADYLEVSF